MDAKKLLKSLTTGRGSILAPHIENYQRKAVFPEKWEIEIRNEKPHDGHYHPSSDCFTPPRMLWLQRNDRIIPRPIPPALRRTFDCGHMWHGYIQSILIDMGFVKPENVERYVTHNIANYRGYCTGAGTGDLIDVQIPGHGSWLVDIKTMNKNEFEAGANAHTFTKWNAQVNCYMDWFGADKAMILAICKDSPHNFREYQIQRDQQLLNEIYDRWIYTEEHVRSGVEPDDDGYVPDPELLNRGDSVLDEVLAKEKNVETKQL